MSFRPIADPAANWANRLMCAAKLALARTRIPEKMRRQKAIEILETAPENGFTSKQFNAVYHQLVPLYLASGYFEEALLHPGFSREHLETFKTAFERFNIMFKIPPSRTVCFYLGVINLAQWQIGKGQAELAKAQGTANPWNINVADALRSLRGGQIAEATGLLGPNFKRLEVIARREPVVRPEVEEFLRYSREQTCEHWIGRRRNQLLIRWFRGEIPAPGLDFAYPVFHLSENTDFIRLMKQEGSILDVQGFKIGGDRANVRTSDKAGNKIVNVFSCNDDVFSAKFGILQNPNGTFAAIPYTLNNFNLTRERTEILLDWLEGRGDCPTLLFAFHTNSNGTYQIIQRERKKTYLHDLPGDAHLVFQPIERNGEKRVAVFHPQDLQNPISEHRFLKRPDDWHKTEPIELTQHEQARRNSDIAREWVRGRIPDPDQVFEYSLRHGKLPLAMPGGQRVDIGPLNVFFLAMPFKKSKVVGLKEWFIADCRNSDKYYFKPGINITQIKAGNNARLWSLWQRATRIKVRLKTIFGEKHIIISQEYNPAPHRYFKIIEQADGSYRIEIRKPTARQTRNKQSAEIKKILEDSRATPMVYFPYKVTHDGQIDLMDINHQRISLPGLTAALKITRLTEKEAADLVQRYPWLINIKDGKYAFFSSIMEADIRATENSELIQLWAKTHRALVSIRAEIDNDTRRIFIGVHHAKTRDTVAEFELFKVPDYGYLIRRLNLSPMQGSIIRGRHFARWVTAGALPPAGEYKYSHSRGSIRLFRYKKQELTIDIGMYNLPKIGFRVSAKEEKTRKLVCVDYTCWAKGYHRVFEILTNEKGELQAEETPESRAVIDALPMKLRRAFTINKWRTLPADRQAGDQEGGTAEVGGEGKETQV